MPVQTSYPGVYVEEIPSGVHNIVGVSTATTAFVDFFPQGPMGIPTQISNYTQFVTLFGGLDVRSEASYGVMQYYLNGGQTAWIVRVASGTPQAAQLTLDAASPAQPTLIVEAASPGVWGETLQVGIDYNTRPLGADLFNLVVRRLDSITNATSPEHKAAAKVLKELVEHHISEEESNVWDDVTENFSDDDRKRMNVAFERAKARVKIP